MFMIVIQTNLNKQFRTKLATLTSTVLPNPCPDEKAGPDVVELNDSGTVLLVHGCGRVGK